MGWLWVLASPHQAIANCGTKFIARWNDADASSYQKLCSAATPRSNSAFAAAFFVEVGNETEPSSAARIRAMARMFIAPFCTNMRGGIICVGVTQKGARHARAERPTPPRTVLRTIHPPSTESAGRDLQGRLLVQLPQSCEHDRSSR